VIAEATAGRYRCAEARWVNADGQELPVTSVGELDKLLASWDGSMPPLKALKRAEDAARAAATQRLRQMAEAAEAAEKAGLQKQLEAARSRLLRELGRTLRCFGPGDLNALFSKRLQQEKGNTHGRYHRALRLLGGFPQWKSEVVTAADEYVRQLTDAQREGRMRLGSELEAALNDPRWQAALSENEHQGSENKEPSRPHS